MAINKLSDFESGQYDCAIGHSALVEQSEAYYAGYSDQYSREQCDTANTEEQMTIGGHQ
jgi:hypothetical protein|tara:strand:+ start:96 stop:272 length:177 start_codon:yes stop_codon:yes gene_type:complete